MTFEGNIAIATQDQIVRMRFDPDISPFTNERLRATSTAMKVARVTRQSVRTCQMSKLNLANRGLRYDFVGYTYFSNLGTGGLILILVWALINVYCG